MLAGSLRCSCCQIREILGLSPVAQICSSWGILCWFFRISVVLILLLQLTAGGRDGVMKEWRQHTTILNHKLATAGIKAKILIILDFLDYRLHNGASSNVLNRHTIISGRRMYSVSRREAFLRSILRIFYQTQQLTFIFFGLKHFIAL